jgi:hypothetical protein
MAHSVLLHLLTTGFGTELPIPNVRSSVVIGGKADKICSLRVLRVLTDGVEKGLVIIGKP